MIALSMKMPEKCARCTLSVGGVCTATQERRLSDKSAESRPDWCPLLETVTYAAAQVVETKLLHKAEREGRNSDLSREIKVQLIDKLKAALFYPGAIACREHIEEGICGDAAVFKAYLTIVLDCEEEHPCEN